MYVRVPEGTCCSESKNDKLTLHLHLYCACCCRSAVEPFPHPSLQRCRAARGKGQKSDKQEDPKLWPVSKNRSERARLEGIRRNAGEPRSSGSNVSGKWGNRETHAFPLDRICLKGASEIKGDLRKGYRTCRGRKIRTRIRWKIMLGKRNEYQGKLCDCFFVIIHHFFNSYVNMLEDLTFLDTCNVTFNELLLLLLHIGHCFVGFSLRQLFTGFFTLLCPSIQLLRYACVG